MFGYDVLRAIVLHAVVEHQVHISCELLNAIVYVCVQLLSDCPEVHWLCDNVEVVVYIVLYGIYWVVEIVPSFGLPA